MSTLHIHFPPAANMEDAIDNGLVTLTEAIARLAPDRLAQGCLGARYENDVFIMHPYCWCEKSTCPWCEGCTCPEGSFHYFTDGKEVDWVEWMAFFKREVGEDNDHEAWMRRADEVNKRRQERHDPVCDYCLKRGGKNAPNFHHKASGLKVRWYKWIGRSMEIEGADGVDVAAMFAECVASLRTRPAAG